jgi:hypothetical protein
MKPIFKVLILFISLTLLNACSPKKEKKEYQALLTTVKSSSDIVLSPNIPTQITSTGNPVTLESLQHDFDVLSWQSFIALNWPANADGTPKKNVTFGEDESGLTVWQSWKSSREIFLPNGQKPDAWGEVENIPVVCDSISAEDLKKGIITLTQVGKTPNVLDESGEPFQTGPLIDQNGNYTRYEILTNEVMFDYIVDNKLYNQEGQKAFGKDANFPFSNPKTGKEGAIMVKAAWIKMEGKYDASKFHTAYALVYDNPHEQAGVKPSCKLVKVGLVGFHIAHKTKGDPQWIWSTFEHVANAPTQGEPLDRNFYNYHNPKSTYPVNEPPARPWNPSNVGTTPTKVERVIPIDDDARALNKKYQAALEKAYKGSVWANYELISTQWPTDAESVSDQTGKPAPTFLANATLETYIQGKVPQTSSNCIACHNNASMTSGMFSDFTYLLQRAEKEKK